jgi:hypothetical protein
MLGEVVGMAGRYTGSYLDRSNGWRAVATLADIGQASLVGRIPNSNMASLTAMTNPARRAFNFPSGGGPDIVSGKKQGPSRTAANESSVMSASDP